MLFALSGPEHEESRGQMVHELRQAVRRAFRRRAGAHRPAWDVHDARAHGNPSPGTDYLALEHSSGTERRSDLHRVVLGQLAGTPRGAGPGGQERSRICRP